MKRITAHQIALSALSCALATIFLTLGLYVDVLLLTAYLLAYLASSILSLVLGAGRFWDLLPFIMFFGLHPIVNELQLKIKINKWVACFVKAIWFDATLYVIWRFVYVMTTPIPYLDKFIIPIILVVGTLFFIFYDYAAYKWRAAVNILVRRISKK